MCPFCSGYYTTTGSLNRHIAGSHKHKRFLCKLCGMAFTRLDSLRRHVKRSRCKKKKNWVLSAITVTFAKILCNGLSDYGCCEWIYGVHALLVEELSSLSWHFLYLDICGRGLLCAQLNELNIGQILGFINEIRSLYAHLLHELQQTCSVLFCWCTRFQRK